MYEVNDPTHAQAQAGNRRMDSLRRLVRLPQKDRPGGNHFPGRRIDSAQRHDAQGSASMKKMLVFATYFGLASHAWAISSPTHVVATVLELRASRNTDCSGAVSIFKPASPTAVDLADNPSFGSGIIVDGTYRCLLVHLKDIVTVTI